MTATLEAPVLARPRLRHPAVAPLAVAALGFAISVAGIATPSVWYDEAATITSATRSWPQLWAMLGNVDAVHALYYFLMHVVFDVFGYSPLSLRMPSALAVAATAALVVVLGRTLHRPRLGLIAGLVFVLLPRVTWSGGEGRSYAITALLAVALTLVFVRARAGTSRRWWIAYSLVALASCAVFIYLALLVVAHGVTVAWKGRSRLRWAVAAGAAGLVSLPFGAEVISQGGQVSWIDPVGWQTIRQVLRGQWFYDDWIALGAWAAIVFAVVVMLRRGRARGLLMVVLPALVVPTLGLIVISVLHSPIYQPRYLTMCAPFAALAIAAGIDAIRWRGAALVSLVLLAALSLPHIIAQRGPEAKENSSWSQVADLIAAERADDGAGVEAAIAWGNVQRHPKATARVIAYSYPQAFEGTTDVTIGTPAAETAQLWETRASIWNSLERVDDADVVYFITSNARDLRVETTAALASAGWQVADTWDFTAVHVLKYERN